MSQGGELAYAKGDGWQAVSLPYDGNELSFVAVLPDQFGSFETAFSAEQANTIASSLSRPPAYAPAPQVQDRRRLVQPEEGARRARHDRRLRRGEGRSPRASPQDRAAPLSDVIHQAFVSVDEAGTEAAAATAVIAVGGTSVQPDPIHVTIDRPFVFFVRDNATGAILFLGRVLSV